MNQVINNYFKYLEFLIGLIVKINKLFIILDWIYIQDPCLRISFYTVNWYRTDNYSYSNCHISSKILWWLKLYSQVFITLHP